MNDTERLRIEIAATIAAGLVQTDKLRANPSNLFGNAHGEIAFTALVIADEIVRQAAITDAGLSLTQRLQLGSDHKAA